MPIDPNDPSKRGLVPFKPGAEWKGNAGGKPIHARNKLNAAFLNTLANDFQAHGKEAIERARNEDPMGYVKAIAALMPKQIEQTQPLDDLTDGELLAGIALLRSRLAQGTGAGESPPAEPSQVN